LVDVEWIRVGEHQRVAVGEHIGHHANRAAMHVTENDQVTDIDSDNIREIDL
jgi:hypothetical protein